MNHLKAYVFFEARPGRGPDAIRRLSSMPGVSVNSVSGSPDILVLVQAPTRQQLVCRTVAAILSAEDDTLDARCVPVRDHGGGPERKAGGGRPDLPLRPPLRVVGGREARPAVGQAHTG